MEKGRITAGRTVSMAPGAGTGLSKSGRRPRGAGRAQLDARECYVLSKKR